MIRNHPIVAAFAFALALCVTAPAHLRAQPTPNGDVARIHFDRGKALAAGGNFAAAYFEFESGYRLDPRPAFLFNMGEAARSMGDPIKARTAYEQFLALEPAGTLADTARNRLAALGVTTPPAEPSGVGPANPIRPPAPELPAPAPTPPDGSGMRLAGYAFGGGGVVLVVAGAYFGNKARRLGDEVTAACLNGCEWTAQAGKDADGRRAQTTQWVLLGAGAAAIVTGGVLYVLGARERTAPVTVTAQPGGAAVTWSGAW